MLRLFTVLSIMVRLGGQEPRVVRVDEQSVARLAVRRGDSGGESVIKTVQKVRFDAGL